MTLAQVTKPLAVLFDVSATLTRLRRAGFASVL
jgi:hypothetical protein